MIEVNADIVFAEHNPRAIKIIVPHGWEDSLAMLRLNLTEKRISQAFVKLGMPRRPISKGKHGQLNRIHGHCHDIAVQLSTKEKQYSTEDVKAAMKRMAVEVGYPTRFNDVDGVEETKSLADASMEEAGFVTTTIHRFADAHGFWLTEYDEEMRPYRSIEGRTREEMERWQS